MIHFMGVLCSAFSNRTARFFLLGFICLWKNWRAKIAAIVNLSQTDNETPKNYNQIKIQFSKWRTNDRFDENWRRSVHNGNDSQLEGNVAHEMPRKIVTTNVVIYSQYFLYIFHHEFIKTKCTHFACHFKAILEMRIWHTCKCMVLKYKLN